MRSLGLTPYLVIGLKTHPLFRKFFLFFRFFAIFGLVEYKTLTLQLILSPFPLTLQSLEVCVFFLLFKCHVGGTVAGVDACM